MLKLFITTVHLIILFYVTSECPCLLLTFVKKYCKILLNHRVQTEIYEIEYPVLKQNCDIDVALEVNIMYIIKHLPVT